MCFAYFKMNKLEKNPKKYIIENCSFLFSKGYLLKVFRRNGEYCFNFYLNGEDNVNNIYLFFEGEYVDCSFSNANTDEVNINTLDIQFPVHFCHMTNIEKMNYYINCIKEKIDKIDIRPLTKLEQALKLSKEKRHIDAYPIYEKLYASDKSATNAFNLFQCAVYCGNQKIEKELYEKLKCYSPNLKKEPIVLSGCFVRYYYGLILCEVNRKNESIEIVDYLINVISHYKITDPTFLYIRGIPTAQMVFELIKLTFDKEELLNQYKTKLLSVLDSNTKENDFKD